MNKLILITGLILITLLINQIIKDTKNLPTDHPHKPIIFKLLNP